MGSRSTINLAYIAGFLDGDGSLMFQIKRRKDSALGWRFMATICFYQNTRKDNPLHWIRDELGIGYITLRNDNITELRINGFKQIAKILKHLLPYIKFKKEQAVAMYQATKLLSQKRSDKLSDNDKKQLVEAIISIQNNNYATQSKKKKLDLEKIVGLTP